MTLDAGALISAERNPRRMMARIEAARKQGELTVIPAVALAQAWRGPANTVVGLIVRNVWIEPFTEETARAVGELLARSGTSDVIDGAVALSAASRRDTLVTSDPDDMRRLAGFIRGSFAILPV